MTVDVLPAPPPLEPPPRADGRRRAIVVTLLLAVSTAMVYGTWLAVDDMGAKPLVAHVTMRDGVVEVANDGTYTWQDARLTLNGEFVCTSDQPTAPGAAVRIAVAGCLNTAGAKLDWPRVGVRDVAVAVTRVPRFPRVNRARTASGTFTLE